MADSASELRRPRRVFLSYAWEDEDYKLWVKRLATRLRVDGVLATGEVLNRFRKSPGPFLLTLPVPIEQARGTTRLLLADLNGYPVDGFDDLVRSYQNDLIDPFPANQRLWRPPWRVQTALTLLRIGLLTGGQNLVALGQRAGR